MILFLLAKDVTYILYNNVIYYNNNAKAFYITTDYLYRPILMNCAFKKLTMI